MEDYLKSCNKIYSVLGDNISKEIYEARIMYSLTGDIRYARKLVKTEPIVHEFIHRMEENANNGSFIIYGAGMRGKDIVRFWEYPWKAFVDNNEKLWKSTVCGLPVLSLVEVVKKYPTPIIIISNRVGYKEIEQGLLAFGIKKDCIINMGEMWEKLTELQYFDLQQLPHVDDEVFVDLGVYDGFSSKMFSKWCGGSFKYIWGFEPDAVNFEICNKNMKLLFSSNQYRLINKATWNCVGELKFKKRGFVNSALDEAGDEVVQVTTLDNAVEGKVTFIKMDIEGAELETLQGAEKLIKLNVPKLAISIYHKKEDIFMIPDLISQYSSEYVFYLRHYSFLDWDTVLYAFRR